MALYWGVFFFLMIGRMFSVMRSLSNFAWSSSLTDSEPARIIPDYIHYTNNFRSKLLRQMANACSGDILPRIST